MPFSRAGSTRKYALLIVGAAIVNHALAVTDNPAIATGRKTRRIRLASTSAYLSEQFARCISLRIAYWVTGDSPLRRRNLSRGFRSASLEIRATGG